MQNVLFVLSFIIQTQLKRAKHYKLRLNVKQITYLKRLLMVKPNTNILTNTFQT